MPKEKMSAEDILSKIEWEGGLAAALDYGLKAGDLSDEARRDHPDFAAAWDAVCAAWADHFESASTAFEKAAQPIEDAMTDALEGD